MEKEKSEMESDGEAKSNAGLEEVKISQDPKSYFSWKRYEQNCVNRVYHSDTDKSTIFDAPKGEDKFMTMSAFSITRRIVNLSKFNCVPASKVK